MNENEPSEIKLDPAYVDRLEGSGGPLAAIFDRGKGDPRHRNQSNRPRGEQSMRSEKSIKSAVHRLLVDVEMEQDGNFTGPEMVFVGSVVVSAVLASLIMRFLWWILPMNTVPALFRYGVLLALFLMIMTIIPLVLLWRRDR